MEKTILSVDAKVIDNNIQELALVGSSFCGKFYKPGKEQCDNNFAQKTVEAQTTGSLWLTRGVERCKVTGVPMLKIEYAEMKDGERVRPMVVINRDMVKKVGDKEFDQSATLPIGNNLSVFSDNSVDEAFDEAIKGEKRIFANPMDIIRRANLLNETYLAEVRALKKYLGEQETLLVNTINSNTNVGKSFMELKAKIVGQKASTVTIEED